VASGGAASELYVRQNVVKYLLVEDFKMTEVQVVKSVAAYVELVKGCYQLTKAQKHLFFRGNNKISYELIPSVFRDHFSEKDVLLDFRQYAPEHNIKYDFVYECDKVLGDIQHFGLPTRLLDWTISPLVALYFACTPATDGKEEDCRIFILNPWEYNKAIIGDYSIAEVHQVHILGRSLLAYHWKFKEIVAYLEKKFITVPLTPENIEKPIAFVSPYTNKRKVTQRGCFTIHGTDVGSLDKWDEAKNAICYLTVPKEVKAPILEELNLLYVNQYSIFPDFDGMSTMIETYGSLFNRKPLKKPSA
jgi:hypothetical protein